MNFSLSLASFALAALLTLQAPPPVELSYTWDGPAAGEWGSMAGDSLKEVLLWTQPPDTIEAGKVDSTIFVLRSTKPFIFYSSPGTVRAANTNIRRVYTAALADSFKLARPALGDSVNFRVTGFIQCRRGSCSSPGSGAWKHIHDYTPRPTSPTIKETVF